MSRSSDLQRQYRRAFAWSLVGAVMLHAALFLLSPQFRASLIDFATGEVTFGDPEIEPVFSVDVVFGPPTIDLPDGGVRQEPPDRFLDVKRVDLGGILRDHGCSVAEFAAQGVVTGSVTLRLGPSGRVQYAMIETSSGNRCVDETLVAVSHDLWYQWLPDDRAPAPVTLVQPMRMEPSA